MTRLNYLNALLLILLTIGSSQAAEPSSNPSVKLCAEAALAQSHTYDVVVYGGTAGGVVGAVAAAREGARVALLEPCDHLGGMVSGGLGLADAGNRQVVGGCSREFFERAGKKYGVPIQWRLEPHVAEAIFNEMVEEAGVAVFYRHRLCEREGVKKQGARIATIKLENGAEFAAKVFVDATYEGDLMAKSGVSYTWGRESRDQYGEDLAGVRPRGTFDQFTVQIPAHDEQGRRWPEVSYKPRAALGSADKKTMAYNFRLCMTQVPGNRVPFPRPKRYDPRRYALLARMLAEIDKVKRRVANDQAKSSGLPAVMRRPWSIRDVVTPNEIPNGKTDTNGHGGFYIDYVGGNENYPDADYKTRARIWQDHVDYVQGLLYFIQHDPQSPQALREDAAKWGLCKDEFVDNNHWPHQLYIREARRMVGDYVMTQKDVQGENTKPDVIGMGSFHIDSHSIQRIINKAGFVENEGGFMVGTQPYQIPYRVLLPKREEATNLLVPICLSASHVAYSTLRMEPVYMIMGQASGLAAKMAIDKNMAVQDVDTQDLTAKLRTQRAVLDYTGPRRRGAQATGISPKKLAGMVQDDEQAKITGQWTHSRNVSPFVSAGYRHDGNTAKGQRTATFTLKVSKAGNYDVRVAYSAAENRATNVPVTIAHAGGRASATLNQKKSPKLDGVFASVGTFSFKDTATITISNTNTDGYVLIDAVQLVPVK